FGEKAVDDAHNARAAGFCFDVPLRGHGGRVGTIVAAFCGHVMGRLPRRDLRARVHAGSEATYEFAAEALFHFARHEPRGNSRPGADSAPDFLGRAWNFDLDLDGTAAVRFFFDCHCASSLLKNLAGYAP